MAIWGDGQMFRGLLQEVVATGGEDCDKTLTRQQNHVAKLLCLQHPIPSQSLESDGVDEIIEDAGKYHSALLSLPSWEYCILISIIMQKMHITIFIQFPLFKSIINMSGYYRLVFLE